MTARYPLGDRWRFKETGREATAQTLIVRKTYDEVVFLFDGDEKARRVAARSFPLSFRREAR